MSTHTGRSGIGTHKHGISGHVHTHTHFTGKAKQTGSTRKAKRTRTQRRLKRGTHVNPYQVYAAEDSLKR